MKKPDFFILGAPKCGTTSLAAWLAEHPDIYMSPEKEPHFFNTDHKRYLNSLEGYERLFEGASDRHAAVGEASVWYLSSEDAVANILAYNPAARFIVMLRNPVEMAPSLHEEQVFTGREEVRDFATAWDLQEARKRGHDLPRLTWEPKHLLYGDMCRLGAQLERLFSRVPAERVKMIFIEDLRDARGVYRDTLSFLGVTDDGRVQFEALNAAKKRRWPFLLHLPRLAIAFKHALGIEGGLGIWKHIDSRNRIERPRAPIDPAMRRRLTEYFAEDIRKLERVTGRDLSHWVRPRQTADV